MQIWATVAAKHATLTSGIGLGAIPATGWDSLDGFAAGVLLAGVGFAAVNSARRVRSCALPPVVAGRAAREGRLQASGPAVGRLTRARKRVDGLLTAMLVDDAEPAPMPAPAPADGESGLERLALAAARPGERAGHDKSPSSGESAGYAESARSAGSDEPAGPAGPAGPGDRQSPDPAATPSHPADRRHPDPATRPYDPADGRRPGPAGWPYPTTAESSTVSAAQCAGADRDHALEPRGESDLAPEPGSPDAMPGEAGSGRETGHELPSRHGRQYGRGSERQPEEGFWGPGEPAGQAQGGYRSRHRLDGPGRDAKPHDGRRAKPRHAAPPARFGVTLGRTLTGARLTSRSAAHAGG